MDLLSSSASSLDVQKLPDKDKLELQNFLRNESQKATIQQSIHTLTDLCFRKCITSKITAGKLDRYEEPCIQNCVDRFMDANGLVLKRLEMMRSANP